MPLVAVSHQSRRSEVRIRVITPHDLGEYAREELDDLAARSAVLEAVQRKAVQRVGLVRFNPFEDTGSNQSFVLAMLDARGTPGRGRACSATRGGRGCGQGRPACANGLRSLSGVGAVVA